MLSCIYKSCNPFWTSSGNFLYCSSMFPQKYSLTFRTASLILSMSPSMRTIFVRPTDLSNLTLFLAPPFYGFLLLVINGEEELDRSVPKSPLRITSPSVCRVSASVSLCPIGIVGFSTLVPTCYAPSKRWNEVVSKYESEFFFGEMVKMQ